METNKQQGLSASEHLISNAGVPYEHGGDIYRHPDVIDLSSNVNGLGLPPEIRQAVIAALDTVVDYPDPRADKLTAALKEYWQEPDKVFAVGNGASDLIFRFCSALKTKRALITAPSFADYEKAVREAGGTVVYHRLREEDSFLLTATVLSALDGVDTVFLCHPNNPTGALINDSLLDEIVDVCALRGIRILLDECFLPFTGKASRIKEVKRQNHVFVLRAFTKLYALAGLRLGYLTGDDRQAVQAVARQGQTWPVNTLAEAAGLAALKLDEFRQNTVRHTASERRFLIDQLRLRTINVFPGEANYLLFRHETAFADKMLDAGILIRQCHNYPGLEDRDGLRYFRTAVKTRKMSLALLKAVDRAYGVR